jgi:hypothetical protein
MSAEIESTGGHLQVPWNKCRLFGQKRLLRPKEVWAIWVPLQIENRTRNLALLNLAIDGKAARRQPPRQPSGR